MDHGSSLGTGLSTQLLNFKGYQEIELHQLHPVRNQEIALHERTLFQILITLSLSSLVCGQNHG